MSRTAIAGHSGFGVLWIKIRKAIPAPSFRRPRATWESEIERLASLSPHLLADLGFVPVTTPLDGSPKTWIHTATGLRIVIDGTACTLSRPAD